MRTLLATDCVLLLLGASVTQWKKTKLQQPPVPTKFPAQELDELADLGEIIADETPFDWAQGATVGGIALLLDEVRRLRGEVRNLEQGVSECLSRIEGLEDQHGQ